MSEREEVRPPWVVYPGIDVTSGFFRQGEGDTYMGWSFNPYFASLTEEEQQAYLKKWNVPDEWKLDRLSIKAERLQRLQGTATSSALHLGGHR